MLKYTNSKAMTGGKMRLVDNRKRSSPQEIVTGTELGNIIFKEGDVSLGYFLTDCGYRLILDPRNMKQVSDYYLKERLEGEE